MPKTKTVSSYRVAVVQQPPVLLHRDKTIKRGVELMEEAAAGGARLVSFPEAWLPGYPEWLWRLRPGDDYDLTTKIHGRLLENAVDLGGQHLKPIQAAARRLKQTVSIGIHERDSDFSRGTLYNTVVLIGPDGEVLNRHRKLMPTNPERMVWGIGDAHGLRVTETPAGRVGGLICWENYMPPGAVLALRAGLRALCGADLGCRQHLGFNHEAHRGGGAMLGAGKWHGDAREGHTRRLPRSLSLVPRPRRLVQPRRLGHRCSGWKGGGGSAAREARDPVRGLRSGARVSGETDPRRGRALRTPGHLQARGQS